MKWFFVKYGDLLRGFIVGALIAHASSSAYEVLKFSFNNDGFLIFGHWVEEYFFIAIVTVILFKLLLYLENIEFEELMDEMHK